MSDGDISIGVVSLFQGFDTTVNMLAQTEAGHDSCREHLTMRWH
jgi:hypothetical protein